MAGDLVTLELQTKLCIADVQKWSNITYMGIRCLCCDDVKSCSHLGR